MDSKIYNLDKDFNAKFDQGEGEFYVKCRNEDFCLFGAILQTGGGHVMGMDKRILVCWNPLS